MALLVDSFDGFGDAAHDAFRPDKWRSNQYNLERRRVREALELLGELVLSPLTDAGLGWDASKNDNKPVFRGVHGKRLTQHPQKLYDVGREVWWPAPTSATRSGKCAGSFCNQRGDLDCATLVMIHSVTNAINFSDFSVFGDSEQEVLLNGNSHFVVANAIPAESADKLFLSLTGTSPRVPTDVVIINHVAPKNEEFILNENPQQQQQQHQDSQAGGGAASAHQQ